ncbi:MAG: hypothetical protein NC340_06120 [Ruminococcus flavefaciens]|nr:hypothetical protein [Ruminococcus flavefaciens]MCM1231247.1 hypothetical protein [Ruminococcus flavefaciens]
MGYPKYDYESMAADIVGMKNCIEEGCTLEGLLKLYQDQTAGVIKMADLVYTEPIVLKALEKVKTALGCNVSDGCDDPIITQFINDWRAQMVYLNLPTNTVEEFIASIKTVYNQWLQYTNAQRQAQNQSMFVNVSALQLENEQNKAEVKRLMLENADLKAQLASFGQQQV